MRGEPAWGEDVVEECCGSIGVEIVGETVGPPVAGESLNALEEADRIVDESIDLC